MELMKSSPGLAAKSEDLTRTAAPGCSVNHRTIHDSQKTQTTRTDSLAQGEVRAEKANCHYFRYEYKQGIYQP